MKGKFNWWIIGVVLVVLFSLYSVKSTKAEAPTEVGPYNFATIPVNWDNNKNFVKVYKVVHQGCELFITVTTGVRDDHSSITTGRGCK